ncbi:MAG: hypothetical protein IM572_10580 [Chitinophagaceae bacterium]|nr:hypothetical protein [Chitinophagaceae bacterium]MCA6513940.1 hypothetical protein [Chitinophagaceae bacterium]
MTVNDILKAVPELKFTELQAYLRNTGWARIEAPKQSVALFQKQLGNNFFETLLPLSKDYSDYNYRIVDVLENIAQVENREVHQVLTDLSIPPGDTVRFRVINKDTVGGTISFLEGFNLLEGAKKALFTTACDIVQPEKYHKRLGLKGAQQFIEECRLGQTEKGSFIASVICPFVNQTPEDKAQQLSIFNQAEEFRHSLTRKVTTRLMSSLAEIKSAIDRGEENRIVDLEGENIISGNFLESIVELNSTKETTEIEIITSWSVFAEEQPHIARSIKFSNDYIPVLENIISKVKPIDKGFEDDFVGKISLTKADPDIHSRTEGEIILNYIIGDEEKVSKARVILSNEDYDKACEAHKQGKSVKIRGKLVTIGRSKTIENPSFEIVQ